MGQNKLITFLGTGNYENAEHIYDNRVIGNFKYLQSALLNLDENSYDVVYVLATKEAKEKHGEYLLQEQEENSSYKIIDIESNISVPNLFEQVFALIDEDDVIDYDITHSFRSVPLIAMAVVNYAKVLENATVNRIWYGNYNRDTNVTTIEDYSQMVRIQEWTSAVDSYLETGSPKMMEHLASSEKAQAFQRDDEQKIVYRKLSGIIEKLNQLDESIATCRSKGDSSKNILYLYHNLIQELTAFNEEFNDDSFVHPLINLLGKITDYLNRLAGPNDEAILFNVIRFYCLPNNLIQQGYTILQENFVTYLYKCVTYNTDSLTNGYYDHHKRSMVNKSIQYIIHQPDPKYHSNQLTDDIYQLVSDYNQTLENTGDRVENIFDNLSNGRNDVNHAGLVPGPQQPHKLKDRLADHLEKLLNFVEFTGYIYE